MDPSQLVWDAVIRHDGPKALSVDGIKRLLEVNIVHKECRIPFCTLLNDISERKYK